MRLIFPCLLWFAADAVADVVVGTVSSAELNRSYGDSFTPDAFQVVPATSKSGQVSVDLDLGLVTYSGFAFDFPASTLSRFYSGTTGLIRVQVDFEPMSFTQMTDYVGPVERFEVDRAIILDGLPVSVWDATPTVGGSYSITTPTETITGDWSTAIAVTGTHSFGNQVFLDPDTATATSLRIVGGVGLIASSLDIFTGFVDGRQLSLRLGPMNAQTSAVTAIPEPSPFLVLATVVILGLGIRRWWPSPLPG